MELLYHVLFYMSTLFYNFFRIDFDLIISNYKTPSVIFLRKNDSPLKDGAEAQIEFDIKFGGGLPLSAIRKSW